MRHITLRQLEVFETIARLNSFTRAAEELFLTQPTVSMQIKKLTDDIGLPLFEQVGKKIYLTEAGKALYESCQGVFEHLSRFEMRIADLKGLKAGKLQLAAVTTAKYFAPRLLGLFCQQYPDIKVKLEVVNREQILERLTHNQDDLYIVGQVPEAVDAVAEVFLDNPLIVLAPADHPLAHEKNITIERICQEPFIVREPGSGTRIAIERFFAAHNQKLHIRMELGSGEAIKQAILGGLGIAVLSRHALALEEPMSRFAILDVVGFPIKRYWYVAYPSGKQLSVVAQAFLEFLGKARESLPPLA